MTDPITCNSEESCRALQARQFELLRTLEPARSVTSRDEFVRECHAMAVPLGVVQTGERGVEAILKADYPNHPARVCDPKNKAKYFEGEDRTRPPAIDYKKSKYFVLAVSAYSVFGNGEENKGWIHNDAGMVYASFSPIEADSWEAARKVYDYSAPRVVDTSWGIRSGPWQDAFGAINKIQRHFHTRVLKEATPSAAERRVFALDDNTRYWGACKKGKKEVKVVLTGVKPTHDAPEDEGGQMQCEMGAWWQVYQSLMRKGVSLGDGDQDLPKDSQYLYLWAGESNPTSFIGAVVDLWSLIRHGEVTIIHDALIAKNVQYVYPETSLPKEDPEYKKKVDELRRNSLFTITLQSVWAGEGQIGFF